MGQNITTEVTEVTYQPDEGDGQKLILTLTYRGQVDLEGQVLLDEELSIEIPSKAPPPEE